ncbi:hypothetical protein [Aquimarina intermedia]|uniref:Uncharacterized protein n=1 Tax=Aquimarina intermedia TaxID=350814 RepID=A0A5S5CF53_9FLAO|nr:hypothetical protein [Aquimarina intermedia]TYP77142.1 hypothetical protein BD809_101292 [Aquimarina intermedia]
MKTEYINLKKAILNNNCPECFATESLALSFDQKRITTPLIVHTKKEVIESMQCLKCNTEIFPGRYTDDIDRVYQYHKKTVQPKSASIKLRILAIVILFLIVLVSIALYVFIAKPAVLAGV